MEGGIRRLEGGDLDELVPAMWVARRARAEVDRIEAAAVKSATFVQACLGSMARSPASRSAPTSGDPVTTAAGGESPVISSVAPAGVRARR